ncbi:MAG TPA: DUF2975 domain-containing protein [Flavisolibacter sp.]|jgi:hypothetical protein
MKFAKLLANMLFYLSRIASLLYGLVGLYVGCILLLSGVTSDLPLEIRDGGFTIFYPFTRTPFFLGDYNQSFITTTLIAIFIYALFLWLLSEVFNAFRAVRLFTRQNVLRLWRFCMLNLAAPVLGILFLVIIGQSYSNAIMVALLHILLGVFTFFMVAIFKQGLELQEEQDLTL